MEFHFAAAPRSPQCPPGLLLTTLQGGAANAMQHPTTAAVASEIKGEELEVMIMREIHVGVFSLKRMMPRVSLRTILDDIARNHKFMYHMTPIYKLLYEFAHSKQVYVCSVYLTPDRKSTRLNSSHPV